jgi:hypothetical protein
MVQEDRPKKRLLLSVSSDFGAGAQLNRRLDLLTCKSWMNGFRSEAAEHANFDKDVQTQGTHIVARMIE